VRRRLGSRFYDSVYDREGSGTTLSRVCSSLIRTYNFFWMHMRKYVQSLGYHIYVGFNSDYRARKTESTKEFTYVSFNLVRGLLIA